MEVHCDRFMAASMVHGWADRISPRQIHHLPRMERGLQLWVFYRKWFEWHAYRDVSRLSLRMDKLTWIGMEHHLNAHPPSSFLVKTLYCNFRCIQILPYVSGTMTWLSTVLRFLTATSGRRRRLYKKWVTSPHRYIVRNDNSFDSRYTYTYTFCRYLSLPLSSSQHA